MSFKQCRHSWLQSTALSNLAGSVSFLQTSLRVPTGEIPAPEVREDRMVRKEAPTARGVWFSQSALPTRWRGNAWTYPNQSYAGRIHWWCFSGVLVESTFSLSFGSPGSNPKVEEKIGKITKRGSNPYFRRLLELSTALETLGAMSKTFPKQS